MTLQEIWSNPLTLTDCYYLGTEDQKCDVSFEVSHIYNRTRPMILYGLNELVLSVLNQRIYENHIEDAAQQAQKMGLKFPVDTWMKIATKLKGRIPLRVQALPDGTWCPKGTPFCQIYNTEEGFGEITSWFEGVLMKAFFPSGCATKAFELSEYLLEKKLPNNRIHSFAYRSYKSQEDAYWGGTAWVLSLTGTDDFHVKQHLQHANIGSIQASAHKVVQQFDNELDSYLKSISMAENNLGNGKGICAIVIDTYDPWRVINKYLGIILSFAQNKKVHVVFRPDSGNVLPQAINIYKNSARIVKDNLPENICSVIIGEGMTFEKIKQYDNILAVHDVPLKFVNYGIGTGFHDDINRDYLGWAMKTSFSNHRPRMKFSADVVKRSIPGQVNIQETDGIKTVVYSRSGLYQDIYFYDTRSERPLTNPMSWDEIKSNIDKLRGKKLQQTILLNQEIQTEIDRIKDEYFPQKSDLLTETV